MLEHYPWSKADWPALLHLRPEDVGYDAQGVVLIPGVPGAKSSSVQCDSESKDPLVLDLLSVTDV